MNEAISHERSMETLSPRTSLSNPSASGVWLRLPLRPTLWHRLLCESFRDHHDRAPCIPDARMRLRQVAEMKERERLTYLALYELGRAMAFDISDHTDLERGGGEAADESRAVVIDFFSVSYDAGVS